MANEYRILNGSTSVGIARQEHDLDISVGNMNAAGALTIGSGNDLVIIWKAASTKSNVLHELENASLRVKRYLAGKATTAS